METFLTILAIVFAGVMLYLLPKYAKFIHQQPKMHMEKMRLEEEQKKAAENKEEI